MSCDCCKGHIHVGDTPIYEVEITDYCEVFEPPLDPILADITSLTFKLPNDIVLTKTATVTTLGSPADRFFLVYEVQPGDGVGSPGEFHDNPGAVEVQGFVHWADGKQFHTDVETQDACGNELMVLENLS